MNKNEGFRRRGFSRLEKFDFYSEPGKELLFKLSKTDYPIWIMLFTFMPF
jgi:hypothetical protein